MVEEADPRLVALFGSATRVRALSVLAGCTEAVTGYRLARLSNLAPTKVYAELRRLQRAEVVRERPTREGRRGWFLQDDEIRALFRRRVRVGPSEAWFLEVDQRMTTVADRIRSEGKARLTPDLSRFRPRPENLPNPGEFRRPRGKDAALRRAGLSPSRRFPVDP
jgi:DNA-binding transcriptional ArsR family regulator